MGTTGLEGAFLLAGWLNGVDPALLSSLCYVESNHRINAYVRQDGGSPSIGVCQVKLATARALGHVEGEKALMDASANSYYAAKYLRKQFDRYKSWKKAVSAYNAGRAIKGNKKYVDRVMRGWGRREADCLQLR